MAIEQTWDDAFEAVPADGDQIKLGPDNIRDLKDAVRSRMQIEHEFGTSDGAGNDDQTDTGFHKALTLKKISLAEPASGYTKISPVGTKVQYFPEGDEAREIVDLDQSQTLTNKTLTSPDINAGSFSAQTCTISNGSPGVITDVAHGRRDGDIIQFTTTDTLPTGLALLTDYFILVATDDTFNVSTSYGGAEVDTSSAGSGTHSYTQNPSVIVTSTEINRVANSTSPIVFEDTTQILTNKTIASPNTTGSEQNVHWNAPFHAKVSTDTTITTSGDLIFGSEVFDPSSSYSTSTSRYTPQNAGYYYISTIFRITDNSAFGATLQLKQVGGGSQTIQLGHSDNDYMISGSGVFYNSGSAYFVVYITLNLTGSFVLRADGIFSGFRIG